MLDPEHVLAPGELVWDRRGRIVALRRARGHGAIADVAVLPGLVDAHVHLQLDAVPAAPRAFVPWIGAVMAARAAASPVQERNTVQRALRALLASGTTAVGEVDSSGSSAALLAQSGMAGRCYRELTGFHLAGADARALVAARWCEGRVHGALPNPGAGRPPGATALESRGRGVTAVHRDRDGATGRERRAHGAIGRGLSPHAPYSVSADLFRAAAARAPHLAIHCAEVEEEQQFLRTGRGPFAQLLASLGRLPVRFQPPGVGAVRWLERLAVLRPTTQLVHCQQLERGDAARIAAAGASIVVCPGTIAWFGREPPPVPAWLRAGIPVALGTDSLASNTELSLRAELQRAAQAWPGLAPRTLLAMATLHGARALGVSSLGRLRRSGRADFLVVPAARDLDATLAAFVHGDVPLCAVVCNGLPVN